MEILTERRIVAVVRWTARAIGIALLGLFVVLAIGEGVANRRGSVQEANVVATSPSGSLQGSLRESLLGISILAMLISQIVAWRWEGIGGLLILGGFALFAIVNPGVRLNQSFVVVGPWLATGLLYLICWWRTPKTVGP